MIKRYLESADSAVVGLEVWGIASLEVWGIVGFCSSLSATLPPPRLNSSRGEPWGERCRLSPDRGPVRVPAGEAWVGHKRSVADDGRPGARAAFAITVPTCRGAARFSPRGNRGTALVGMISLRCCTPVVASNSRLSFSVMSAVTSAVSYVSSCSRRTLARNTAVSSNAVSVSFGSQSSSSSVSCWEALSISICAAILA